MGEMDLCRRCDVVGGGEAENPGDEARLCGPITRQRATRP
jgi:hypothetical protein